VDLLLSTLRKIILKIKF